MSSGRRCSCYAISIYICGQQVDQASESHHVWHNVITCCCCCMAYCMSARSLVDAGCMWLLCLLAPLAMQKSHSCMPCSSPTLCMCRPRPCMPIKEMEMGLGISCAHYLYLFALVESLQVPLYSRSQLDTRLAYTGPMHNRNSEQQPALTCQQHARLASQRDGTSHPLPHLSGASSQHITYPLPIFSTEGQQQEPYRIR